MINFDNFYDDLKKLVSFKSVSGEPAPNKPFGEEVYKALDFVLTLGKKMGFEVKNYDNYGGEIAFGKGEEIGIIGHVDVVPVGGGWTYDPFTLTHKDGFYYGRGTADDKAPLLLTLYIMQELKKSDAPCNKRIRLFVGCDEEVGWRDVEYIKTKTNFPEFGFSPDGNFPVSYAEKGILITTFSFPKLKKFTNIVGGTVVNAVCGEASCQAIGDFDPEKAKAHGLTVEGNKITSIGVSAHGSHPELGKNALLPLFEYFLDEGENVKNILDCLFYDKHKVMNLTNPQGNITMSPDLIRESGDKIEIVCDVRVPAPFTMEMTTKAFDNFNIDYRADQKHPPVMVERDGWFVNTLKEAYNNFSETKKEPVSMGGSTFARVFDKGCAFGMEFPNENGHMHEADERISEKSVKTAYEIYRRAIFNLVK